MVRSGSQSESISLGPHHHRPHQQQQHQQQQQQRQQQHQHHVQAAYQEQTRTSGFPYSRHSSQLHTDAHAQQPFYKTSSSVAHMQGPDRTAGLQSGSGAPSAYSQRYSIQELGHSGQKYMDQGQLISRDRSLSPRGYPIPGRSPQYPHTLIHGQTSDIMSMGRRPSSQAASLSSYHGSLETISEPGYSIHRQRQNSLPHDLEHHRSSNPFHQMTQIHTHVSSMDAEGYTSSVPGRNSPFRTQHLYPDRSDTHELSYAYDQDPYEFHHRQRSPTERRASLQQQQKHFNSTISPVQNLDDSQKVTSINDNSKAMGPSRSGSGLRAHSLGNIYSTVSLLSSSTFAHTESSTPAESENPIGLNLTPGQGQLVKKSGTGASSRGEGSMGSRTQYHAPLEPEVIAKLDELFFKFLQRLCSDLNACDSRGDQIHQPLMAKKMQRLEASTDFRPFKFRIQAFTNAFHESLVQHGLTEDILPLRKVKVYLWKHKYISRFNEDGKKQKSKGNHVWNIEARRIIDPHAASSTSTSTVASTAATAVGGGAGSSSKTTTVEESIGSSNPPVRWEFRKYSGRIAGQIIKFARVGVPYIYSPRIWDAQIPCPKAEFSSPWLPSWLKWHKGELRGIPGPNDESCTITVIAEYVREGEPCRLEMEFPLTVSDPLKEGELMDMPNEDEGDEQEFEDDDSSNGEDDEEDEVGVGGGSGELRQQESAEARGRGGRRKQPSERRALARAKVRQENLMMLKINTIARPDQFLNEGTPFVNNSAGIMNFTLTSPKLLDLASYQRTLKDLIYVLASLDPNKNIQHQSSLEIYLGSGGTLVLDTSVIEHDSMNGMTVPSSQSTTPPDLYYIRLPWNPHTDPIQCQLSARRLCVEHVSLLDRILKYLCDAAPGAFMVSYSDGLSGVDAGVQVVYSGEDSSFLQQQQHWIDHLEHRNGDLDQDRGNVEMDHCVPELSGHIEHPGVTHGEPKHSHLEDSMSKKGQKASKSAIVSTIPSLGNGENVQSQPRRSFEVGLVRCMHGRENGILDYDFELLDDIDPLMTIHDTLDADDLYEMLWV
ncbi:hypothetical protein BGZ50_005211 [Haplosporangium sp. Z 11]|nr:hypothetical protein BGZ50_005211 [Haplosporangium sp. Z 11]